MGHTQCASYDGGLIEYGLLCPRAAQHNLERSVHPLLDAFYDANGDDLNPRQGGAKVAN